jgi:hypothetical protein
LANLVGEVDLEVPSNLVSQVTKPRWEER